MHSSLLFLFPHMLKVCVYAYAHVVLVSVCGYRCECRCGEVWVWVWARVGGNRCSEKVRLHRYLGGNRRSAKNGNVPRGKVTLLYGW